MNNTLQNASKTNLKYDFSCRFQNMEKKSFFLSLKKKEEFKYALKIYWPELSKYKGKNIKFDLFLYLYCTDIAHK